MKFKKLAALTLAGAMSLHVDQVWLQTGGTEVLTPIDAVRAGDRIVIRTGSVIPLDGRVSDGEAMVNQSSMTGESMPVAKRPGSYVYAGPWWRRASAWSAWKRPPAAGGMTASSA